MSEVIRYLASHTPYEGLDLNGQCARHDGDYFVSAYDFDRVTAERDALQQRLTAADERVDVLGSTLRKYIEHVERSEGTNFISWIGSGESDVQFTDDEIAELGKAALKPAEHAKDEHVCTGCGSKGWTANCKECVPY